MFFWKQSICWEQSVSWKHIVSGSGGSVGSKVSERKGEPRERDVLFGKARQRPYTLPYWAYGKRQVLSDLGKLKRSRQGGADIKTEGCTVREDLLQELVEEIGRAHV